MRSDCNSERESKGSGSLVDHWARFENRKGHTSNFFLFQQVYHFSCVRYSMIVAILVVGERMRRKIFHRWHTYRGHSELWNYGFVELFWGNYGIMELWNYGIIWNDGNSGNVACVSTPVVESPLSGPAQFHSDGSWSHSRHCRGYVPGGVGHWRLGSGSAGRQLLAGSRRMITLATATLLHLRSWTRSALFFRSHFSCFLKNYSRVSHLISPFSTDHKWKIYDPANGQCTNRPWQISSPVWGKRCVRPIG